jgi:hypothetical protein
MLILFNRFFWLIFICFIFLITGSLEAQMVSRKSGIEIQKAWTRATPPNAKNAAVYMILQNDGPLNDLLLDVQTPAAKIVELHTVVKEKEMMFMQPVENISIPAHSVAVLQPGGSHMMLVNLKEQLKIGNHIDLTLKFMHAGEIRLKVPVQKSRKDTDEHHEMRRN